jgi:hypothetical protein
MGITLRLAAAYNIAGGLAILFFLPLLAPLIRFEDSGQPLFRLFAGGTAVLFGAAYFSAAGNYSANRRVLVYGAVLKYWAFAISVWLFLSSRISLPVLIGFGGGNAAFAALFTYHLLRGDAPATCGFPPKV